ncbi:hypothetical protein [Natronobacterium gregoryi]|uniref:Uncharacterized protein n=2 Tax=Natronobacterium gregoryi TaxID=44930 RepID=L0AJN8_NATGS|nr:hypothetical protein [Natronobacterium gregoryi]AFZ74031.1 hypothetical protein Natgr_2891 [Natronobacterium gregoryi SP2]ELY70602.1 hypothetical protein C490_06494 [Natronobacterium gregoryi SP2]PLK20778.1 hypothetical protein CYV19_07650 [Natronobacterium gregoryi SP2]SFJ07252.1 hypothetical protein SAMN05443661_11351 [Natronobacterium gregoryi]
MYDERSDRSDRRFTALRDRIETGMDRREFLRTLAGGGYALGLAHYLGVEDFLGASDDEIPAVTALVRSDPTDPFSLEERVRYVPADWYAAVEKAFELNELLAQYGFTGYLGSAVVPGAYDSGTASVSIGVSSEASTLPEAVREFADGISISTETILEVEGVDEEFEFAEPRVLESLSGRQAPSGVACETPSSLATLGPAMYDPETERSFFTTAEHAFEGVTDPIGETLSLPLRADTQADLGVVDRAHPVADVAAVSPNPSVVPSNWIDAPEPVRVRGQLTRFGLADLVARGEQLEKVGALTGHTSGRVQGVDAVTCFTDDVCRRGQIRWGGEMDLTDGDSGSVSYYPDPEGEDEDVLVAGFNNARTWWPGQSYVWGVSAYHLTAAHGYHF